MPFYVYIIQSEVDGTFYKGSTENPKNRIQQHNEGLSKYTSTKLPWKLVYVEELLSKKEMLIRERKLKRGNAEYFQKIIFGNKNIVRQFL